MKLKNIIPTLSLLLLPALCSVASADTHSPSKGQKENSINISPLGIAVGSYNINYERLLGGYHGILGEIEFAKVSDEDAQTHTYGANIGYRYHWRGQQNSGFVGLNLGYATGDGDGSITKDNVKKTFDVDTSVIKLTANLGKRWAWNSGFNITFRLGAGYGNYTVTAQSQDPDAQEVASNIEKLLTIFPVAVDGELSIGYIF